ncbi:acyl-CoA dehydrogenase family protein [Nonomuraea fuscirosea]|uniref:acyl-CoA dehydrogenase family protein n=1 Tax=Nonomuraea fuscirosea TaxID=1291556 RepID=UPI003420D155
MDRLLFDDEHDLFRASMAAFTTRELLPHQERFAAERRIDRAAWRAAGEQGFLGLEVPAKYGGGAAGDYRFNAVACEELASNAGASWTRSGSRRPTPPSWPPAWRWRRRTSTTASACTPGEPSARPTPPRPKWWSAQVQNDVLDACVQLHGGYGYMSEYLGWPRYEIEGMEDLEYVVDSRPPTSVCLAAPTCGSDASPTPSTPTWTGSDTSSRWARVRPPPVYSSSVDAHFS